LGKYLNFYHDPYHDIIRNSSFFRPKLRLEFDERKKQNDYAPSGIAHSNTQRYLRIYVENKGYTSVHNCQAEMVVVIPDNANPMLYPSDERKVLAWGRFPQSNDFDDKRTIRGHGKELLHIVFSDSLFDRVQSNKEEEKRLAGVSTKDNLQLIKSVMPAEGQTYLKPQDGFTVGKFDVEISITSDEGPYVQARLTIYVESNFQGLRMKLHSRRLNI
jgi:hypothetical protein